MQNALVQETLVR